MLKPAANTSLISITARHSPARRMRLALHTVICCCVFTSVLPLLTAGDASLKKRFKVWLQSRMKRDVSDGVEADGLESDGLESDGLVTAGEETVNEELADVCDGRLDETCIPCSPDARARRSTSGCALVTCLYHDLLHRLHQFNNKHKEPSAPEKKMGSGGYGRRRRRSLPGHAHNHRAVLEELEDLWKRKPKQETRKTQITDT